MPYVVAQVVGAIVGGRPALRIASGAPGFDVAKGFASNGFADHSPGKYNLGAAFLGETVMTGVFLLSSWERRTARRPRDLRRSRSGSRSR